MIDLCLSGGGVRAAVFHLGVLKALAEADLLGEVERISSVSGGSIVIGLLYHENNMKWPTDAEYLDGLHDKLLARFSKGGLQLAYAKRLLLNPFNWLKITAAGDVLSKTINSFWGISEKWDDVPQRPIWSVNITSTNTGKRWRFKKGKMGDYLTGYTSTDGFKLSDVMAISAGFPLGVGPYRLHTKKHKWHKYERELTFIKPKFKRIDLMDGGVYDNLGLDAFYDCGKRTCRCGGMENQRYIIVSDASAPLESRPPYARWRLLSRAYRMYMISYDQIRLLRIRTFVGSILQGELQGMYVQLGGDPERKGRDAGFKHIPPSSQDNEDRKVVRKYGTNLGAINKEVADSIATNSYEQTRLFILNTYPSIAEKADENE